jgi:hypothetical protein
MSLLVVKTEIKIGCDALKWMELGQDMIHHWALW